MQIKDGREKKIRLVRKLLHFASFKNKKRPLVNEFSFDDNETKAPRSWKPTGILQLTSS